MKQTNKKITNKTPIATRRPRRDSYSEADKKIACSSLSMEEIATKLGRFNADGTPNINVVLQLRNKLKKQGYEVKRRTSWSQKTTETAPETKVLENKTSKQFKFFVDGVEFKIAPGVKSVEVDKEGVRIEL